MNRPFKLACVALLSVALGCSHVVRPPLEKEVARHDDPAHPWVRVEGFTGRNGVRYDVPGYAWITQDSLLIYRTKPQRAGGVWGWGPGSERLAALGRPDVDRIHVKRVDPVRTIVLLSVVGLLVAGAIAAAEIESTKFGLGSH